MFLKLKTTVLICVTSVLYTAVTAQECGEGYISLDITGACTNSTCLGECRDKNTCCLEMCFAGISPSKLELEGCANIEGDHGTCSQFASQTDCLANKLNKTYDACWKHTLYYISSHPGVGEISGFNPVNCPCEYGQTLIEGGCYQPQCLNSSYCQLKEDQVRDTFVCCLDKAMFPHESDCGKHEKLDKSIKKNVNVSTLADCQEICQEGICKMPDANRFPACCVEATKIVKQADDGSIHGSVIAVIITPIVVLLIAGTFIGYYVYRTRLQDKSRKIDSQTNSIEITGVDEMIGGEQAWNDDVATFSDISPKMNGFLAERETDVRHEYDEFDHVSTPEFDGRVQSIEKLRTGGNTQQYDNHIYIADNEKRNDEEISTIFDSY
ncbi:uncharacterized protein LOC132755185 [Ruditapes philippinarum]|uniref:uncharacterized protein LOC132755185 n=1 Tax=Ruditapes philippinarum TaxID=129788 RepID=UPI00295B6F94|nr:uncharacterized protein LOC132755185 [Ruditapes philippinarum]